MQCFAFHSLAILVSLLYLGPLFAQAEELLPVTFEQAVDESTLQERILDETQYVHPDFLGKTVRVLKVGYFSHAWKDGPWTGKLEIYLPSQTAAERRGLMVMAPSSSSKTSRLVNVEKELLAGTALHFGIPVCSIPQPRENHLGKNEVHQLFDTSIGRFIDTGDPGWIGWYPYAALNMRAYTLVGKVTGTPTRKVVHMGSSITAAMAFITATYDRRVSGVVITGNLAYEAEDALPDASDVEARQAILRDNPILRGKRGEVYRRLFDAPPETRRLFDKCFHRGRFASNIDGALLQVAGSNDFATPHLTVEEAMKALPIDNHLVYVPNYPMGAPAKSMQMRSACGSITATLVGR